MGYRLEPGDRTTGEGLRRIAAEEFAFVRQTLADAALPLPGRVHALRKSVKKLRGLLRLARPAMPGAGREIAALGAAGRGIGALRDAEVLCITLEGLLAGQDHWPAAAREALLAPFLAAREAETAPDRLGAGLDRFGAAMEAIAARTLGLALEGDGFDALAPGLGRTWRAARTALAGLPADPEDEALHDLRKRVKDHWYQARILAPIWPEMMEPHVAVADALGETLGRINDLAVLRARLRADDRLPPGPAAAADALAFLARGPLLAEARLAAARLLADRERALLRRWGRWWQLWQEGG